MLCTLWAFLIRYRLNIDTFFYRISSVVANYFILMCEVSVAHWVCVLPPRKILKTMSSFHRDVLACSHQRTLSLIVVLLCFLRWYLNKQHPLYISSFSSLTVRSCWGITHSCNEVWVTSPGASFQKRPVLKGHTSHSALCMWWQNI